MKESMNAQSNLLGGAQQKQATQQAQEIDLMALLGALLDRKLFIIAVTALFMVVGVAVAVFSTPIYQATAMIQVEEKGGSVPGFDELGGMFESTSAAVTEIELLKSRSIIGEAVDSLKLDIVAEPKLFPIIGGRAFRSQPDINTTKEYNNCRPTTCETGWDVSHLGHERAEVEQVGDEDPIEVRHHERHAAARRLRSPELHEARGDDHQRDRDPRMRGEAPCQSEVGHHPRGALELPPPPPPRAAPPPSAPARRLTATRGCASR